MGNATQRKLFFEYPNATESYEHSEQPNPCRQEGPFVFRIAGIGGLDQSMTKRENLLVTDDRVLLSHKTKSFLPCFL